jgi:aerobic carbon-monoxide dehydrogenase large subunit
VMAQIAADTLGLPLGQVRVLHGSTPFLDEGYGAFASRSTVLGGSAVFEGANALLAKIRAAAAPRLGCAAEQVELADGCARGSDGRSLAGEGAVKRSRTPRVPRRVLASKLFGARLTPVTADST